MLRTSLSSFRLTIITHRTPPSSFLLTIIMLRTPPSLHRTKISVLRTLPSSHRTCLSVYSLSPSCLRSYFCIHRTSVFVHAVLTLAHCYSPHIHPVTIFNCFQLFSIHQTEARIINLSRSKDRRLISN